MQYSLKRHLQFLLTGLVLLAIGYENVRSAHASSPYVNEEYGYSVTVPERLDAQTDPPPSPQHGFQIVFGGGRYVWVDGSYDAETWGSANAAVRQLSGYTGLSPKVKVTDFQLAGLPAASVSGRVKEQLVEMVTIYRDANDGGTAIVYTLGLNTDPAHKKHDEHVFADILMGFKLEPIPK